MKLREITTRIETVVHSISKAGTTVSMILLILMSILIGADVIARYIIGKSIYGTLDVLEMLLVFIVFFTTAEVAINKRHIQVELVTTRVPSSARTIMACVTSFASLVIVALITWQLGKRAWKEIIHPTIYTPSLDVPISPFLLAAALGSLVLSLVLVIDFLTYIFQSMYRQSGH